MSHWLFYWLSVTEFTARLGLRKHESCTSPRHIKYIFQTNIKNESCQSDCVKKGKKIFKSTPGFLKEKWKPSKSFCVKAVGVNRRPSLAPCVQSEAHWMVLWGREGLSLSLRLYSKHFIAVAKRFPIAKTIIENKSIREDKKDWRSCLFTTYFELHTTCIPCLYAF